MGRTTQYWQRASEGPIQAAWLRTWEKDRRQREQAKEQLRQQAGRWNPYSRRMTKRREEDLLVEVKALRQELAALESDRDTMSERVHMLERSLAQHESRRQGTVRLPWTRHPFVSMSATAGVLLVLGALAGADPSRYEQNQAPEYRVAKLPVIGANLSRSADEQALAAAALAPSAGPRDVSARKLGARWRKKPEHRQWGPPLLAADALPKSSGPASFDPLVKEQQKQLLALGFDLGQARADGLMGTRTQQALTEFQSLYLSGSDLAQPPGPTDLTVLIRSYADLAREDAQKFNIDRGVLAAIRLSSVRTGVEFSFLMELASAESGFNPAAQASGSSAVGLYQFTHDTWLNTVKAHGEKYGLGEYAAQIEYTVDRRGYTRPRIADEAVYKHVLALRKNPRVAAMMAAESVKANRQRLAFLDAEPGRTELYLTHFLGTDGAISFLRELDRNPKTFASELFPSAAESNQSIFHPQTCEPRTVTEIYELFSEKFHTSRFDDWALN